MALISFVFPFYNEEQSLDLLIRKIREIMAHEPDDFEMIFVNDASTDRSVETISREAQAKGRGKIVLVNMSRRFGVEESFLSGIAASQGDAVVLMYTDMQDPPEVVSGMLKYWREGSEVVHTVRRRRIGEHPLKKLAAFMAYRLIGRLSDTKIPFDAGEFKLISRNVARHLLSLPEAEPYLRGLIPWIGFKQNYIEYDMRPRPAGRSKVPLFGKKAWSVFLSGIITFSDFPVYFILISGLLALFVSVVLAVILLMCGPIGGSRMSWLGALFLWGGLMFSLGMIGLYILKIYKNTRGRPRYIVERVVRFDDPPR